MSYKTILVHVDSSRHAPARIKAAAQLAIQYDAHLVGAAMTGISRFAYADSGIDLASTILAAELDALYERAEAELASFDTIAASEGVLSYERALMNDDPAGGLAQLARYADLVVLSQTDHDDPVSRVISDVPEYVMLNSGGPVLILPYAGHFPTMGGKVLVAWNDGIEAARAVANAIPVLQRADKVTLAVFNAAGEAGRAPGADIALRLARHGVTCEAASERSTIDIGNSLLSLAADLQSDLIVMGGYGHTRFRELLLGGVTATLLHTMTMPVLMSH